MRILGYTYQVERIPALGAMGRCDVALQIIRIDANLPADQARSTMLHEIIEALNHALEMDLPHGVICQLEAGLYQVLVDAGIDLEPLDRVT